MLVTPNCIERLKPALAEAIEQADLSVVFQPRVNLAKGMTETVEALVRWHHPEFGMVPPTTFIPWAEQEGWIHDLGRQVMDMTCRQASVWRENGIELIVSVNVSAIQLRNPRFLDEVMDCLTHYTLPANLLEIELTESAFIEDIQLAQSTLNGLRELGVKVTLDDFGTGFSGMRSLQIFPFDYIKIDRGFIQNIESNDSDLSLVGAMISFAKMMQLKVVAEGVESREQLDILRSLKCDQVQGFYFSKPVSPELVELRFDF